MVALISRSDHPLFPKLAFINPKEIKPYGENNRGLLIVEEDGKSVGLSASAKRDNICSRYLVEYIGDDEELENKIKEYFESSKEAAKTHQINGCEIL